MPGFPYNTGVTKQADLIAYLFEGQPHLLSRPLMHWMDASSRFTAFVETYRDKIRKKIRITREPESALDLRSELEAAYCLLADRRLGVAYEPYASAKRRGPDFAVTYRANLVFNVEVARIRGEENEAGGINLARKEERILRILLDKLGQMQPGMANLLVIQTPEELRRSIDLDRLMQEVKTRAEGKDPSFYALGRYTSPAAFYRDFLRLSGILLWAESTMVWVNKQARPGLAEKVLRLVSLALQERALPPGAPPA
ncbi:MAG: hypothetical protein ACM3PY_08760 [Omnitrophica WOR_2 bacterium]